MRGWNHQPDLYYIFQSDFPSISPWIFHQNELQAHSVAVGTDGRQGPKDAGNSSRKLDVLFRRLRIQLRDIFQYTSDVLHTTLNVLYVHNMLFKSFFLKWIHLIAYTHVAYADSKRCSNRPLSALEGAYSWGLNSHGQLGIGDTTTRTATHSALRFFTVGFNFCWTKVK